MNSIKILQPQYIIKIIQQFGMEDSIVVSTPLPIRVQYKPTRDNDQLFKDISKYQ